MTTIYRDKATVERQSKATAAALVKMHRLWHEVQEINVCRSLNCRHSRAPR